MHEGVQSDCRLADRSARMHSVDPSAHEKARWKALLAGGRWFSSISERLQDALLAAGHVRALAVGERLFSRGDPPSGLFALLEGSVRITATTEMGREALLTLVEPPSWFGEIAVFDGQPRTHDAIADEAGRVLVVPQQPLQDILAREPRHWRELGLLVTNKLRLAFLAMEDAATQPLGARLARRLVLMAEGYGERPAHTARVLEIRQEQLASMLTTSRQTVNQQLKELEARGCVRLSYGQVEVLDLPELKRAAGLVED